MNTQEEILNGQTGGKLSPNTGEKLIRQDEMPGTPFTIVSRHTEQGEYLRFLALGKYRLTNDFDSTVDIEDWLIENQWTVILNILFAFNDITKQLNKEEQ